MSGISGCAAPESQGKHRLSVTTAEDVVVRLAEVGASSPDQVPLPSYEPAPYVAFSLRAARQQIEANQASDDYRPSLPEAYYLGGISRIRGAVYDRDSNDLIIVGYILLKSR